jgi:hypothetical protein
VDLGNKDKRAWPKRWEEALSHVKERGPSPG